MKCQQCQSASPEDSVYCVECGARLGLQCQRCAQPVETHFKFCNKCGHNLSTPVSEPVSTAEQSIAHEQALEARQTSSPEPVRLPEGERRQATVLFSDLSGYTAMNERLDPEDVEQIMGRIKAKAVEIVEAHGGTVNQFVGDEVLALFGIPTAHHDDPARAARAALELHKMTRAISPELEPRIGRSVQLHTGINTGLIVTSQRDDRDGRIGVTGDTINTGARLKALAQDDTVLLGPETHSLVSDLFETKHLEPVALKGKAEKITPHQLIGERQTQDAVLQPIIGRRAEIRQFTGIVEECEESGRGQTIYVRADVGVGKSKLIEEFRTIAAKHGFECYKGLVLDFGGTTRQDAVRGVVSSLLGIVTGTAEEERRDAIVHALEDGIVDEQRIVFLYDLLDLSQPDDLRVIYDSMDNETRIRGKRETLCELLRSASEERPGIVEIENIQWADHITLENLAALAATVAEVQALMVMTSRLDDDPIDQAWRATSQGCPLATIDLAPLRKEEALELAHQYPDVSPHCIERCIERAAGNPLFLVQLLRTAEESDDDSVPSSVQSVVLARVDRLPADDRQAIQVASVFGQKFSLEALRNLLGNPGYRSDSLIAHLLVRPEGDEYMFVHSLIQEGVYGSLLMARRAELHSRAAEWFATRDLPLRAEHLDRAKHPAAPQAFLEAARDQTTTFRYERALVLAERGLELDADRATRFTLMCQAGELRRTLGRNPESIDAYREAEQLAADEFQRCSALIGQVQGLRLIDRSEDALVLLENAEQSAVENQLAGELAQVHYLRGNLYFPLGNLEGCLKEHGEALEWARKAETPEAEARALGGLGDANYLSGKMTTACDSFRNCVDLCQQHGLGQAEVANLPMVGWSALFTGSLDHALEFAQLAIDLASKANHYRAESQGRSLAGFINFEMGAFAEAGKQLNLALDLSRKLNARRFEAHFICDLARLADAQGDKTDALRLVEEALSICRETGMNYIGPTVLGAYALITNDEQTRRSSLDESDKLLREGCVSHNYFLFYRDAMDVCLDAGDWDTVDRYAAALEDYARQEPLPWSHFFADRGRTLSALGRGQKNDTVCAKIRELSSEANHLRFKLVEKKLETTLKNEEVANTP